MCPCIAGVEILTGYLAAKKYTYTSAYDSDSSTYMRKVMGRIIREPFKYYFADFVRKGGGVPPKSVTPFLPGKKSVKGGGTPLTDKIRKVVFEVFPKGRRQKKKLG